MRAKQIIQPGSQFGRLTVVADSGKRKNGNIVWRCRCRCGNEIDVDRRTLLRGSATSCGCVARLRPDQVDITGERYGMLTAEYCTGKKAQNGTYIWHLRCDCGNEIEASARELSDGYRKSCGCRIVSETDAQPAATDDFCEKTRLYKNNTSGCTGVYFNRRAGKWTSQIQFRGKSYYLGFYEDKADAVKARRRGEEMYDDFLNCYSSEYPPKKVAGDSA